MRDLYRRLSAIGFDADFVRNHILPDWWDDAIADVPANRALAEAWISKMLRLGVAALQDASRPLRLPPLTEFRLKRRKGTPPESILPAIVVAEQTARNLVAQARDVPPFAGRLTAVALRRTILQDRSTISLQELVQFSWGHGIPVLHIRDLPKASRRFCGMALFCGETPVIVLASGHDGPPWLAFHLAHELGHVLLGHVQPGGKPLADGDIDQTESDMEERQADEFACYVLTGNERPDARVLIGMRAPALARMAKEFGPRQQIDPGVLALVYGRNAGRMPVAAAALKLLDAQSGAREMIASALRAHLPADLSETGARFADLVTVA